MKHVHVGKNSLLLFLHDADPNGVHADLIHILLKVGDLICIQDGFTLLVLVVILTAEMLERFPVLFAEDLMLQV